MVNLALIVKTVTRVMVSPDRNALRGAIVRKVSQSHALLVRMASQKESTTKPPRATIAKPDITNPVLVNQRAPNAAKAGIPVVSEKNPQVLVYCAT